MSRMSATAHSPTSSRALGARHPAARLARDKSAGLARLLASLYRGMPDGHSVADDSFMAASHAQRGPDAADRAVLAAAVRAGVLVAASGGYAITDAGRGMMNAYVAASCGAGSGVPSSEWVDQA